MIQRALHQQLHPICQSAQRQGDGSVGALYGVGEVGGDGADGEQVFGGVGQEGFGVDVGGDGEEMAFAAFGRFFVGWGEVVSEGAVGGFLVELFGVEGSIGGGVSVVWGVGRWFEHGCSSWILRG